MLHATIRGIVVTLSFGVLPAGCNQDEGSSCAQVLKQVNDKLDRAGEMHVEGSRMEVELIDALLAGKAKHDAVLAKYCQIVKSSVALRREAIKLFNEKRAECNLPNYDAILLEGPPPLPSQYECK